MSLPERLSEIFLDEGIISEEDREMIQFGLESMEGNLAGVFLVLAVGILFGKVTDAILFYVFFFPLRKSIGGFHANTRVRCLLSSTLILLMTFMVFSLFENSEIFYWSCFGVCGCVIFLLAPVDNPAKRFDAVEQKTYRKRSKIILAMESILFIASFFSWILLARSLCMTFFVACTSILLGVLKNGMQEKEKDQKDMKKLSRP